MSLRRNLLHLIFRDKRRMNPRLCLVPALVIILAVGGCGTVRRTLDAVRAPAAPAGPPVPPAASAGDAQANACIRVAYTPLVCERGSGYRAVYTNLCPAPVRVTGCDASKNGDVACHNYEVEGNGRNTVSLGSCEYGELSRWGACRRPDRACDERLDNFFRTQHRPR